MKYLVAFVLFFSLSINSYSQVEWGLIRGKLKIQDSLESNFTSVIVLKNNDTFCFAAINYRENLEYRTCNLDTGLYDLLIDMKGYHIIKINNIRVRADAISFQDIVFNKSVELKGEEIRRIIELEYKLPVIKGGG